MTNRDNGSFNEREKGFLNTVGRFVSNRIKAATEPLEARIKTLEFKLAQTEIKAREMRYAGVWTQGVTYKQGNFVTWSGSLWHCNFDCDTQPGRDFDAWQLVCKRGADSPAPAAPKVPA